MHTVVVKCSRVAQRAVAASSFLKLPVGPLYIGKEKTTKLDRAEPLSSISPGAADRRRRRRKGAVTPPHRPNPWPAAPPP
ncbi:hypothetical protein E2C01_051175 [Portunus trituberculatus]|uniref:Uncharacterized protein n=1 Tax=Portunus trituberculatus TaxID=210409 RepID=A0A5B7GA97_PORTR|nr:hypothetical protein [Portunus trituberculatus]